MRRGGVAVLVAAVVVAGAVAVGARVVDRGAGPGTEAAGPGTETVEIAARRGRILDRSGKVLVEDGTVLEVRADADELAALDADRRSSVLSALAEVLAADQAERWPAGSGIAIGASITRATLGERLAADTDDDRPVLARGVGEAARQAIEGDPDRFPGITVEPVGGRLFRYGALAAHVLGPVGRALEEDLRGEPGRIVHQLDEDGQRVRELADQRVEPEPGRDVYLTVDINLQYLAEKALAAEVTRREGVQDNGCFLPGGCDPMGAAAVAVDPRTGQVLALASYPTFDPALLAADVLPDDREAIAAEERGDEHRFPLLDRATAGQYAPGATFKPFVAHAGLATGLITPDETYDDTGIYRYSADCPVEQENNCSAQNAGATPHGAIDLADALRVSSDTYFYALGDRSWRSRDAIGDEALQRALAEWGFGSPTGIESVTDEAAGRVPTPAWLREFSDALNADDPELAEQAGTWTAGVSGNLANGQGDVLVTPLQLAQAYGTLANGGTIWRPQLVLQSTEYGRGEGLEVAEPERTGSVDLPAEWRVPMVEGLDGVTKAPGGTASTAFAGFDQSACPVMGKTGTAQVTGKNDTSLFAAVAPTPAQGREPAIALAVVVDQAGFGAAAAVPAARRVLEPFAAAGCDITAFGAPGSPYEAPLGGRIDVAAAMAEYVPPSAASSD